MIVKKIGEGFPRVAVVGCVHGDELIGKHIIENLEKIKPTKGEIKLILANTLAMEKRVRYIDSDLNRVFPGKPNGNHEEKLAHKLTKELQDVDYVIDIHSTTAKTESFVIVTKRCSLKLAKLIPLKKVVLMTDKLAKGKALIDHVRCGVSIEFSRRCPKKYALNIVKSALANLGIIKFYKRRVKQEVYEAYDLFEKPENFVGTLRNFSLINRGEIIGYSNGKKIVADEDFYPIFYGEKAYKNLLCLKARKQRERFS